MTEEQKQAAITAAAEAIDEERGGPGGHHIPSASAAYAEAALTALVGIGWCPPVQPPLEGGRPYYVEFEVFSTEAGTISARVIKGATNDPV